ncbi:hypothetical protein M9H77_17539 [Catharanthus roseus]|uniref:Uncharacterized protein n=2 Tax=Catharanthus roseus TaxID=4058 RepID=A0ACC0B4X4_CATRO|nr:hypothetical protein M9H77_17538 [Catharanthus roseus]KAI5667686.1 hypothetical protein M9H77_17539 [Catharanthus roseus]
MKEARKNAEHSLLAMVGPVPTIPNRFLVKKGRVEGYLPSTVEYMWLPIYGKKMDDRESQKVKNLLHGAFTSAGPKKIKDNDRNMANSLVVYMEKALKIKLEGFEYQGKASKLLSICTISKDQ